MARYKIGNYTLRGSQNIIFMIIIVLYSYLFVFIAPWELIKGHGFADIENYLWRIDYLTRGGTEEEYQGIAYLFSEKLWKYLLVKTTLFVDDYREILYLASVISLTIYSFFTFKRVNVITGMFFMMNPMFIDLIMGQVRIALAFALLLVAYEVKPKKISFFFVGAAILIHTAALLLFGIYFLLRLLGNRITGRGYYFYSILIAALIVFFLKFGVSSILLEVGDKRAQYADMVKSSSVAYSIFWFLLSLMLSWKAKIDDENKKTIVAFSIAMMSLFFFSSVIGLYGQRYVAISIPLIIISISYLPKFYRQYTFLALGIYQALQWFYWIQLEIV